MEVAKYQNYCEIFSENAGFIQSKIGRGAKRQILLIKSVVSFKKAVDFEAPMVIIYEVFNYFRLIDLKHLHLAVGERTYRNESTLLFRYLTIKLR